MTLGVSNGRAASAFGAMEQGRASSATSSRTGAVAAVAIALLAALVVGVVTLVGGDPHDQIVSGAAATATTLRAEPATAPLSSPTTPIATAPPVPIDRRRSCPGSTPPRR